MRGNPQGKAQGGLLFGYFFLATQENVPHAPAKKNENNSSRGSAGCGKSYLTEFVTQQRAKCFSEYQIKHIASAAQEKVPHAPVKKKRKGLKQ